MIRCTNYSIENKQCKYYYTPGKMINLKDLKSKCDGYATPAECCWFTNLKMNTFIPDSKLKRYRAKVKEAIKIIEENEEVIHGK